MAQKIEFLVAGSTDTLAAEFAAVVARYSVDANYIVTPIGFAADSGAPPAFRYVLAVSVDATHKRIFQDLPEPESATDEG